MGGNKHEELLKAISCEPSTMAKVEKVLQKYAKVSKDTLDADSRKHIAEHNFALPGERKYPINDISHARNALARSSGKPEEAKVKAAVYRKFPSLKPDNVDKTYGIEKDTNEEGPLDDRAQAALKAVVRILTPFKDSLSPLLLHEVLDAAGLQTQRAEERKLGEDVADEDFGEDDMKKSATMSPEPIKEEHHIELGKIAKAAAQKAVAEHLEKLGYRKYPDAKVMQKTHDDDEGPGHIVRDEPGQEEEQEGTMHNPDAHMEKGYEEHEEEMEKGHMKKRHVAKMDLAGLPSGAKRSVEAIFKANQDLQNELDALKRVTRKKEMVSKAATEYSNLGLPVEEVADALMAIEDAAPKAGIRIQKMLAAANEQVGKGSLFAEYGSSHPGGHVGNTWEAIQKAAEGYVAKSGTPMTREQAVERFLDTAEGKRMYAEYMKGHPSSK